MNCFVCQNSSSLLQLLSYFTQRSYSVQLLYGKTQALGLLISQSELLANPAHGFQAQAYEFVQRNPDLFA
jgi:hypothetical protein